MWRGHGNVGNILYVTLFPRFLDTVKLMGRTNFCTMCLAPFCHFPSLPAMVHLDYDAKWRLSRTACICTCSMRYMAYENFQNVTTVSSFSWTFQNTQKFSRAINSRGERIMDASFVFPETAWKTSWTPVHDNETPRWGAKSDFPCYFLMWNQ